MKKIKLERTIFLVCLIICLVALFISGLEVNALEENLAELQHINSRQAAQLKDLNEIFEIQDLLIRHQDVLLKTQDDIIRKQVEPDLAFMGEFEITYYCPCTACCGKTDGITASGTLATEGQTVSADWDMLPSGTKIYIDGVGFRTVEDKGGAIVGQTLDVFVNSHAEALELGRHKADVWIVEE